MITDILALSWLNHVKLENSICPKKTSDIKIDHIHILIIVVRKYAWVNTLWSNLIKFIARILCLHLAFPAYEDHKQRFHDNSLVSS